MTLNFAHGLALMALPAITMCLAIFALPNTSPDPRNNPPTLYYPDRRPRAAIGGALLVINTLLLLCLSLGPYPADPTLNLVYIVAGFIAMFSTLIALIAVAAGLTVRRRARKARRAAANRHPSANPPKGPRR